MTVKTKYTRQTHPDCGETMTEQHHAKSCNINYIVAKYQKTGLVEHTNRHQGSFGDVSAASFEDAMQLITEQQTVFNELPSSVRKHYEHDVAKYLEATSTPSGVLEHENLLNPIPEVRETEIVQENASQKVEAKEKVKVSETETVT